MLLFPTVIVKLSKHNICFAHISLYNQRSLIRQMLERDFRVQECYTRRDVQEMCGSQCFKGHVNVD